MAKKFWTKRGLAHRYQRHTGTIDRWVRQELFPPPIQISGETGACLWPDDVIEAWEAKQLEKAGTLAALETAIA